MKILFVIDSLGSGGAQRQMANLALGLQQKGHNVDFFLYYPHLDFFTPMVTNAGIKIYSYQKPWKYSLRIISKLRSQIISKKYELVLSFLKTPNFYAEIACMGLGNFPLVISERSVLFSKHISLTEKIKQQMHHLATHITVNSHNQRDKMVEYFPWMKNKISTIYNGIDLENFYPDKEIHPRTILKLLALGSVVDNKNPENLIRALSKYQDYTGNKIRIRWAGKVTSNLASQRTFQNAEKLIDALKIRDQWEWLGERNDIPDLIRQSDALIHPSFYEGLPNAICEALACGKPVLASRVCDHPILIKDGWNGYLFDPHSPDDMAKVIHKLASLPDDEFLLLSANARRYAEDNLSLERYVAEYENLFYALVSKA